MAAAAVEVREDLVKGELHLTLPGPVSGQASFTLCFDVNALIALEGKLKLNTAQIGALMESSMTMGHLRTVMWAGLQEHHEGIGEKDVGKLMNQLGTVEAMAAIVARGFQIAFPTATGAGPRQGGDANAPADP